MFKILYRLLKLKYYSVNIQKLLYKKTYIENINFLDIDL